MSVQTQILIVIGLSVLLIAGVLWLAKRLWRWRAQLVLLNQQIERQPLEGLTSGPLSHLSHQAPQTRASQRVPREIGYELMLRRSQIAQTRLDVARWQLRSRQIRQVLQFLRLMRSLWLYRIGRRGLFTKRARTKRARIKHARKQG